MFAVYACRVDLIETRPRHAEQIVVSPYRVPVDWTPRRIKTLREDLRLDQADFAQAVGAKLRTVQSWEAGHGKPSAIYLRNLDQLLATLNGGVAGPAGPLLREATNMELLEEFARRLNSGARAEEMNRLRVGGEPLDTPTTLSGPTVDRTDQSDTPDSG